MKRSTWRSKISPFTELPFIRRDLPLILTLLAILIGVSCQLGHKGEIDPEDQSHTNSDASASSSASLNVHPPLAPPLKGTNDVGEKIVAVSGADHRVVAELSGLSCDPQNPPTADESAATELRLTTTLNTDFGTQEVRMLVRGEGAGETVRAEVEGYRLNFSAPTPIKKQLVQRACAAVRTHAPNFQPETLVMEQLAQWLELAAPDCDKITPAGEAGNALLTGWHCRLPAIEPDAAHQELSGVQATMVRRWSRQPYLLARRLAVGVSLAQALQSSHVDKSLNVFCNIVTNSLPIELPATLASKRWQAAVCNRKDGPERLAAAKFGLAKTVAEIDFMRLLFERTSRLGFLTLRIPPSQSPAKELLISLEPESDVADNLAKETVQLWLADSAAATPQELPHACWHPVYAEDKGLLKLASQLGMAGIASRIVCEESDALDTKTFAPERYFAESVTSETQFVLPNGRSKTLRLPVGKYSYTIRTLPEDQEDWDDAAQSKPQASGEIVWDAKRPRPIITSWQ